MSIFNTLLLVKRKVFDTVVVWYFSLVASSEQILSLEAFFPVKIRFKEKSFLYFWLFFHFWNCLFSINRQHPNVIKRDTTEKKLTFYTKKLRFCVVLCSYSLRWTTYKPREKDRERAARAIERYIHIDRERTRTVCAKSEATQQSEKQQQQQ